MLSRQKKIYLAITVIVLAVILILVGLIKLFFLDRRQNIDEEKSVGIPSRPGAQMFGQEGDHRHAGEVVVAKRGVTNMAGEQDLLIRVPLDKTLPISETSALEVGVDAYFVLRFL